MKFGYETNLSSLQYEEFATDVGYGLCNIYLRI